MPVTVSAAADNCHLKIAQGSFSVVVVNCFPSEVTPALVSSTVHPLGPEKQTQGVCPGNLIQGKEVGKMQPVMRAMTMTILAVGPCYVPVR